MVVVKFLVDYCGPLTDGKYFKSGQEAKFPPNMADELVEAGRWAKKVVPQAEAPKSKAKPKPKAKSKAKAKPKKKAK